MINKPSKKIRTGDKVIAIAGNNKGLMGTVLSKQGDKVIVQGLNVRKKHVKPTEANQKGGIIELEKPIHISNVKVVNADDKPVKLSVRESKKGGRELVYKSEGKDVVHRSIKKSTTK
jgi:large subunit ribosomal protein L24